ncbi:pyridoxamine 5'-phosphate oxidase family protein [Mycolicibacterium pyrenivorans]|uniref:pyridoxamine 5'-phosphate oxidase family protein n=1 Tax=Mycolicibacterium pyrenivorans TaxID=187102 RepID=UPI0021F39760|nr:pyridoxamine 5'-phosphate oxidase family protein [Mycolicibacterium pyrenivorans]MCV7151388.1 pyridoxamine 5'-phosphate oxidase family protein [Mycolicibacterium pyrenivorans]
MSVKVDLDQLAAAMADFTFAYLVTVGDDYRAHTVAVHPVLAGGVLGVGPVGNRTRRNAGSHADVTLVWPPREPGGYTLIVDGAATVAGDELTVAPGGAVLHRPALPGSTPGSPTASGCGDDCVPLTD